MSKFFKKKQKTHTYFKEREITSRKVPFLLRLDQWYNLANSEESLAVRAVNNESHDEWMTSMRVDYEDMPFDNSFLHDLAANLNHLSGDSVSQRDLYNFIEENYLAQGVKYTFDHVCEFLK